MSQISLVNERKEFSALTFTEDGAVTGGQQLELIYNKTTSRDLLLEESDVVFVDTRESPVKLHLPASPSDGAIIRVIDGYNTFGTHPLVLSGNGNQVQSVSDYSVTDGLILNVVYNVSIGWEVEVYYTLDDANTAAGGTDPTDVTLVDSTIKRMVERYDRDSNGSYITDGYDITYVDDDGDDHVLRISEGVAHVDGIECINNTSQRVYVGRALDYKVVTDEPHTFVSGTTNYTLRWSPIRAVSNITGIKETTTTVTHGVTGGSDLLEPNPVVAISSVYETVDGLPGGSVSATYTVGTDFTQSGDYINWSPGGSEPTPGSTYHVTYTYTDTITPTISADLTEIVISGLADGSTFYVDYSFYISRVDRLLLTRDNEIRVIRGTPDALNPTVPSVTGSTDLPLAQVDISYGQDPIINTDYYKILRTYDLQINQARLEWLEYNISQLSLMYDANARNPTLNTLSTFVDPFKDDDMRDTGMTNDASIINETLELPVEWINEELNTGNPFLLDYTEEVFVSQTAETTTHKVEPYAWADITPAYIKVSPDTYKWLAKTNFERISARVHLHNRNKQVLLKQIQDYGLNGVFITKGVWDQYWLTPNNVAVYNVSRAVNWFERYLKEQSGSSSFTKEISAKIPAISLAINGKFYAPNETVTVTFDGIEVDSSPFTCNASGVFSGSFTVPADQDSGTKLIRAVGDSSGMEAEDTFVAVPTGRWTRHVTLRRVDPIAQTFIAPKRAMISSFEVKFTAKPSTWAIAKLCETTVGIPDDHKVIAHDTKEPSEINADAWTKFSFNPSIMDENEESGVILQCLDRNASVRSAKLGQWDRVGNRWLTTQPLANGVLLDSSTSTTWTPHQEEDLTFRVNRAVFSSPKTVALGTVAVTAATDLMVLANADTPEGTTVYFEVTLDGEGDSFICSAFTPLRFATYTGDVSVSLHMSTNDDRVSPLVNGDITLSVGSLQTTGTYTSRSFSMAAPGGASGSEIRAYALLAEPGGSSVAMQYYNPTLELSDGAANLWTQSSANSNLYYYTGAALERRPEEIEVDGVQFAYNDTIGSIAATEWAWGDIDTIGSDTVYVYVGVDPDAQAAGYISAGAFFDMTRGTSTAYHELTSEVAFSINSLSGMDTTKIRLILNTSSSANRPIAQSLRAIVNT